MDECRVVRLWVFICGEWKVKGGIQSKPPLGGEAGDVYLVMASTPLRAFFC